MLILIHGMLYSLSLCMEINLNTRIALAFLTGLIGLTWQGIIVTFGGTPSEALVTAFTTIMLASIGIGIKQGNGNDS